MIVETGPMKQTVVSYAQEILFDVNVRFHV